MKALSLTQPWATLVAAGAKTIETRSWQARYRGPLAIHAAKGFPPEARAVCRRAGFYFALEAAGIRSWEELPTGVIVATCRLVDVKPTTGAPWVFDLPAMERAFGDYSPGRFGWFLEDVQALAEPVPAKGAQGLWEWRDGSPAAPASPLVDCQPCLKLETL